MLSPTASGLVGLIVIESTADSDEVVAQGVTANDATLGEILRWLARGLDGGPRGGFAGGLPGQPRTPSRTRRAVAGGSGLNMGSDGPALVAADCRGLGDQLERAARQLIRRIARAHADGR